MSEYLKKTNDYYRTYVLKLQAYNITPTIRFIISYSSVMSLLYYHITYNYPFTSHIFPVQDWTLTRQYYAEI